MRHHLIAVLLVLCLLTGSCFAHGEDVSASAQDSALILSVSEETGFNQLTWAAVPDAVKYKVYRDGKCVSTTKLTSYKDSKVTGGTSYLYQVEAILSSGESILSEEKKVPEAAPASTVSIGDYITFGTYPQTAEGNDKTPIEWLVLEVQGDKALLLSRCVLDIQLYNKKDIEITWEKCTLRSWLNHEFFQTAFNAEEQQAVLMTKVDNSAAQARIVNYEQTHQEYHFYGGKDTEDKIFLLSFMEANKYFGVREWEKEKHTENVKARAAVTEYAKAQGALTLSDCKTEDGRDAAGWWLRSLEKYGMYAAHVGIKGVFGFTLVNTSTGVNGVRPALWVDLSSGIF